MDLTTYLQLPIRERYGFISKPITGMEKTPFWQERLNTAVINHSPITVSFNNELIKEYWDIINFKNQQ